MIDKDFCLSSYLAYRYIYDNNYNFFDGMHHEMVKPIANDLKIKVADEYEIDVEIQKQFDELYKKYKKIGILLSGGMDSAILSSYLKPGSNAYTFSSNLSDVYHLDIERASWYCKKFKLNHILIDISFDDYKKYTPIVIENKCAPVHSIEPQIYKAAMIAKENGDELIIIGESSDLVFGGMNKLLAKEWNFNEFKNQYIFLDPKLVLNNPFPVERLFEKYKLENNKIDFLRFLDEVFAIESSSSYYNAFKSAKLNYYDPYERLIMKNKLDLKRVRNGESKYLIRALYKMKFPEREIPEKIPMPRPVDDIFKNWKGPKRKEFKQNIDMNRLSGNQKWQLWCAELFLNIYDK